MTAVPLPELIVGGAAAGIVGAYARQLYPIVKRRFTTVFEIDDDCAAYWWLQAWLSEHEYSQRARHFTVATRLDYDQLKKGTPYTAPAPGVHLLRYRGKRILLTYSKTRQELGNWARSVRFECWGNGLEIFQALLREGADIYNAGVSEWIHVNVPAESWWVDHARKRSRSLDSVILTEGRAEAILQDAKNFFANAELYAARGIPWNRGYLLYGPPGNGKSSLATALATELSLRVYALTLHPDMSPETLHSLLGSVPPRSLLLLEEVDTMCPNRELDKDSAEFLRMKTLLATLLNGLDGLSASEGRLVLMTTNHPERLDPALVRPGRCDLRIEFPNATKYQAKALFLKIIPDRPDLAEAFSERAGDGQFNMAALQGFLLKRLNVPESTLVDEIEQDEGRPKLPLMQAPTQAPVRTAVAITSPNDSPMKPS